MYDFVSIRDCSDGTTDVTRTIAFNEPSLEQKRCNTLVLKGHIQLARQVFPEGTNGKRRANAGEWLVDCIRHAAGFAQSNGLVAGGTRFRTWDWTRSRALSQRARGTQ